MHRHDRSSNEKRSNIETLDLLKKKVSCMYTVNFCEQNVKFMQLQRNMQVMEFAIVH